MMHAPIRRNAASCLATASFAFADGQQPRVGAISCASEGTGLSIPRAATPRGHREAGPARGGLSHRKAEFIETPLSKTIAKLRPRVT